MRDWGISITMIKQIFKTCTPRCVQEVTSLVEMINEEAERTVESIRLNGVILENIRDVPRGNKCQD